MNRRRCSEGTQLAYRIEITRDAPPLDGQHFPLLNPGQCCQDRG
jgi:hypothetical protein